MATSARNSFRRAIHSKACGKPSNSATCSRQLHTLFPMRLLPLAQLLRLPNVFTAFGDILLGTLVTGALLAQPLASGLLLAASGCLYCSGMVWNDFFDLDVDRMERPFRPLPSGKIAKRTAGLLAAILLLFGVV